MSESGEIGILIFLKFPETIEKAVIDTIDVPSIAIINIEARRCTLIFVLYRVQNCRAKKFISDADFPT